MELSIIVPCLNEEANLPELVRRIGEVLRHGKFHPAQRPPTATGGPLAAPDAQPGELTAELVLVDDGSTDRSPAVMVQLAAAHPFVRPQRHPHNRGITAAWKTGVAAARGHLVCLIDADLQYQPED